MAGSRFAAWFSDNKSRNCLQLPTERMRMFLILTLLSTFMFSAGFFTGHRAPVLVPSVQSKFTPAELEQIRRGVEFELRDWQKSRKKTYSL
jgi:hypothetical protein